VDPIHVFSSRAALYAKYRWDYAPQAIQTILDVAQVSGESCVADIGAGTGILAKHFAGKAKHVLAVEPNAAMRQIAAHALRTYPSCQTVDGRAEATTLPDHSVDLITVAQSIHWFEPGPARREFVRVLKRGGWLAILRNHGTDEELGAALSEVFDEHRELDTEALMVGRSTPAGYYYGGNRFVVQTFPFTAHRDWDAFIGSLSTTSSAPDEGSPSYACFVRGARRVFGTFARNGVLESHAATELYLGQLAGP